jgi:hypothetical protein
MGKASLVVAAALSFGMVKAEAPILSLEDVVLPPHAVCDGAGCPRIHAGDGVPILTLRFARCGALRGGAGATVRFSKVPPIGSMTEWGDTKVWLDGAWQVVRAGSGTVRTAQPEAPARGDPNGDV